MVINALGSVVIGTYMYNCFHLTAPQTAHCGGKPKRSIGGHVPQCSCFLKRSFEKYLLKGSPLSGCLQIDHNPEIMPCFRKNKIEKNC